jgi:hypothetical protein
VGVDAAVQVGGCFMAGGAIGPVALDADTEIIQQVFFADFQG